jgi:multimeric flavodoxin WrbA
MADRTIPTPRTALALNCTLKRSPDPSSTDLLCSHLGDALRRHDVSLDVVRIVDHDVKEGVTADEGDGDGWPAIRQRVLDAEIVVIATPIWLGNPSSVCRKVLERLDAFLGETDDEGRMTSFGRVGIALAVGNEDGAHNTGAQVFQALSDVGFTIPAGGQAYWVGEAMGSVDYRDLDQVPDGVSSALATLAANAAHLAGLLRADPYPPAQGS